MRDWARHRAAAKIRIRAVVLLSQAMRILLGAIQYFGDVAGGGNRVALDIAQYLASLGHDVALLCEGIPGKQESEQIDGIRVLRYRVPSFDINFVSRHQRAGRKVLLRQLHDWQPDLLWGHMPLQMAAMMDVFPSTRMTYTMHSPVSEEMIATEPSVALGLGLLLKSKVLLHIERRCCLAASVITVLSEFTKSEIRRLHGESIAAKVRITPGWADLSRFRVAASKHVAKGELGWPQDRKIFFCIRRLVARMGLDRLIEAAAILRDRSLDFQLYIAGIGPLRTALESQIVTLHLQAKVLLLGAVTEQQLSAMYSAADASVIPTRALECFGLIAVEAMSAGTPVLSTPVGSLPEIINGIEPQWLARDNSAAAIADLMADFLQGRLPAHSANEVRHFVESHYDKSRALDHCVKTVLDLSC